MSYLQEEAGAEELPPSLPPHRSNLPTTADWGASTAPATLSLPNPASRRRPKAQAFLFSPTPCCRRLGFLAPPLLAATAAGAADVAARCRCRCSLILPRPKARGPLYLLLPPVAATKPVRVLLGHHGEEKGDGREIASSPVLALLCRHKQEPGKRGKKRKKIEAEKDFGNPRFTMLISSLIEVSHSKGTLRFNKEKQLR